MNPAALTLAGEALLADPLGALYWPKRRLLALADLHLEKGSGLAARGLGPLPPYDTRATLVRLAALVRRYRPAMVACLGDSFHDRGAGGRIADGDRRRLDRLVAGRDWVWVAGNHDPAPPERLGGRALAELALPPLIFRHEALPGRATGEVSGHFHPKAVVPLRTGALAARCFVTDGRRLILPAFGAFAGGLEVLDAAIDGLFPTGYHVLVAARGRLYAFPRARLLSRAA